MSKFNWGGDRSCCRWCGRKLRIEVGYEKPDANLAAELVEWLTGREENKSGWYRHPVIGRFRAFAHGTPGSLESRFRVQNGLIRVGVRGGYRQRAEAKPGEHDMDSVFCTWVCGTLFADRIVELGTMLKPCS